MPITQTNPWLLLGGAVLTETIATMALKSSAGFTRLWPSALVVVGYGVAFYLLAITLKSLPVGIVYAAWSGAGIVLISLLGLLLFGETLNAMAISGIALIIGGIALLNFSRAVGH
ncbi:MAG: multidrug efflux SMR transporter [Gallionellaceae bacterium]|jgi:small multidrug resistance pump|nr:multidrug efflux SMR transporter [Gallionellaceae bacterium]